MKLCTVSIVGIQAILLMGIPSRGEIRMTSEHISSEAASATFRFQGIPAPLQNDVATRARFTLVDGRRDRNGGDLVQLHDGRLPAEEDQPGENFFFAAGTDGGQVLVDLGGVIAIKQINTYSWHPNSRGPQVYVLYASAGNANGFDPQPRKGTDPQRCGWQQVAKVDTRSKDIPAGGQYGVRIDDSTRTPGWIVEGICDYARWFLYEPQTHGAEITARNLARARYDGNYRISANFLNWVTETYCKDIVQRLNAAAREGKYTEELWKTATGHTVQELGDEWKASLEKRIAAEAAQAARANTLSDNER